MQLTNSITEYGLVSKLFHWLTFVALLIQIPMGFYLVDLDYSDYRIFIEDIHVTLGLSIFYLVLFRLLNFLFKIKLKSDFDKADFFYDIHIYSNYTLIALISLHVFAVIIHRVLFKENILKRIT